MEKTITFTPKNVPYLTASFLSKDQQKEYENAVRHFRNERARKSLNVPVKGSNLFKVLLLNQIGIRTATLSELDQIVQSDGNFLKETYEDAPSVVLRSNGDSYRNNDYLAKNLSKLIKKKTFNEPVVINGLELVEDNNSAYGLNFKRGKSFDYFEAPELSHLNHNKKFAKQDERGMPVFDENGAKTIYTRDSGLSGLCLNRYLNTSSRNDYLTKSSDDGRVVVVKTSFAGSQKILDEYLSQIQKEYDKKINNAKQIAEDAIAKIRKC